MNVAPITLDEFCDQVHMSIPTFDAIEILNRALYERLMGETDFDIRQITFSDYATQIPQRFGRQLKSLWGGFENNSPDFYLDDSISPKDMWDAKTPSMNIIDAASRLGFDLLYPFMPSRDPIEHPPEASATITRYWYRYNGLEYRDEVAADFHFFRPRFDAEAVIQLAKMINFCRYRFLRVGAGAGRFVVPVLPKSPSGAPIKLWYIIYEYNADKDQSTYKRGGVVFAGRLTPGIHYMSDFDPPTPSADERLAGFGMIDIVESGGLEYLT